MVSHFFSDGHVASCIDAGLDDEAEEIYKDEFYGNLAKNKTAVSSALNKNKTCVTLGFFPAGDYVSPFNFVRR